MFTTKKIAIVSVINDLATDNRVNRTCLALTECGYEVVLIGRKLPGSMPLPAWPFEAERMKLLFIKGPLFYLFFTVRLFFKLLFKKAHLLYANDLDTLLPNFVIAKLKNIPLIYDSHELFTEVPELQGAPFKRGTWLRIESAIVPRLKWCITVNQSIADIFTDKYKVPFSVVRNIPDSPRGFEAKSRQQLNLPAGKKIILMQGAGINIDRGAEELVEAMQFTNGVLLLIIGSGDCWAVLKQKVKALHLGEKVRMIEKIPREELAHYTLQASLGLSIDKNTNPNYYNSLPNKIFDYLHAGVPILSSRLPEIEKVINTYSVGDFIENHQPGHIAERINTLLNSEKLQVYKANTAKVKQTLNWQNEKAKLLEVIKNASGAIK